MSCRAATRSWPVSGRPAPISGEFMGMPATGKSVDVELIDIMRLGGDGLVHEHWGVFDALLMMRRLGFTPEAPA